MNEIKQLRVSSSRILINAVQTLNDEEKIKY